MNISVLCLQEILMEPYDFFESLIYNNLDISMFKLIFIPLYLSIFYSFFYLYLLQLSNLPMITSFMLLVY